jgi:hypothetical protein
VMIATSPSRVTEICVCSIAPSWHDRSRPT